MRIPRNPFALFAVSMFIALSTILIERSFWHIGYSNYLLLLNILALSHVVVSTMIIIANPGKLLLRFGVIVILIIGQRWPIELIAMVII